MTVLITLTLAGSDVGPFNLYSDADGYTTPFETGVSRAALIAGYTSTIVPVDSTTVLALSTGACNRELYMSIEGAPTTTTTTSTSTSTTTTTTTTEGPALRLINVFGSAAGSSEACLGGDEPLNGVDAYCDGTSICNSSYITTVDLPYNWISAEVVTDGIFWVADRILGVFYYTRYQKSGSTGIAFRLDDCTECGF